MEEGSTLNGYYFVSFVLWLLLCQELPLGIRNLTACKHTRRKKPKKIGHLNMLISRSEI